MTCSAPTGEVSDGWPCIAYKVTIACGSRKFTTDYHLGVGHVDWSVKTRYHIGMPVKQQRAWSTLNRKPGAQLADKQLWADTAATIAVAQKVKPSLDQVLESLALDSQAFTGGESFADWASNYGYNEDSRKAEQTFHQCVAIGAKLTSLLGIEALLELQSIEV